MPGISALDLTVHRWEPVSLAHGRGQAQRPATAAATVRHGRGGGGTDDVGRPEGSFKSQPRRGDPAPRRVSESGHGM